MERMKTRQTWKFEFDQLITFQTIKKTRSWNGRESMNWVSSNGDMFRAPYYSAYDIFHGQPEGCCIGGDGVTIIASAAPNIAEITNKRKSLKRRADGIHHTELNTRLTL